VFHEALVGSLLVRSDTNMDKSESFENLYHKRSAKFSFGRARDDSFPDNADNLLNCRYRFFTRISFTSGIQDVPFAYVDWIILQNVACNSASLTVGHISEVEWTTGPKQRPNQWSKPPYLPLERLVSSRYGIGLDPESITGNSKIKKVSIFALDPERVLCFSFILRNWMMFVKRLQFSTKSSATSSFESVLVLSQFSILTVVTACVVLKFVNTSSPRSMKFSG
jgi:hypothetical protein